MLKIANHTCYFKTAARNLVTGLQGLSPDHDFQLRIDDEALTLCAELHGQKACFSHSFSEPALLRRARQKNQALLKACQNKKGSIKQITDLTAGWGKDAFVLAHHGLQVSMVEQHPLLFHALEYLLAIGRETEASRSATANLRLFHGNSLDFLQDRGNDDADCYYLDPMFPQHKSGARPGKDLQMLQRLTLNQDIEATFRAALQRATQRVVVKRPLHAPVLDQREPDLSYREKTIRFDVYLTQNG